MSEAADKQRITEEQEQRLKRLFKSLEGYGFTHLRVDDLGTLLDEIEALRRERDEARAALEAAERSAGDGWMDAFDNLPPLPQEERGRWISADERLPIESLSVLVCGFPWGQQTRRLVGASAYVESHGWVDPHSFGGSQIKTVTHWQPAPEAVPADGTESAS